MFLAAAVADGSFQETHSGSSFLKDFGQIGKIIVVNNNQPFCRQGGNLYGFAAVKPVDFVVAGAYRAAVSYSYRRPALENCQ